MDTNEYLRTLAKCIKVTSARKEIIREYEEHIEDHKAALINRGFSEEDAVAEALNQLGDPISIGTKLNQVHRRGIEWGMTIYYLVWAIGLNLVPFLWSGSLITSSAPDFILYGIAGILALAGFFVCFLEKYTAASLFYAWADNWDGGGLVNSGLILAIAIVPAVGSIQLKIFWIILIGVLMNIERYSIAVLRDRKEQKLLWEIGVAATDISYKGQGIIDGKKIRVKCKEAAIKEGSPFVIIGLEGFKPVAMAI